MANAISKERILDSLKTVYDPDLKKDLVTLGMIRDLSIDLDGVVSLTVVLTTPACPLKEKIKKDVENALDKIGVKNFNVKMDAEVKGSRTSGRSSSIPGVRNLIAVSSGKGGVGKSTTSVNLAIGLAKSGASVGLMDADIYGPNIPTMMGVIDQPEVVKDQEKGELFVPPVAYGVKTMSMGFLIDPDQPMIWRGPMLHSVVTQFCHNVSWGELDYLVIDMPPGTGDVQLSLAQLVPITGAVLVTTPQEIAMQDVRKAYRMWEKVKVPIIGVVENMSYFQPDDSEKRYAIFGEGGGELLAKKFNTEVLANIPIEPQIREGADFGKPISISQPDSISARVYQSMTGKVAQKVALWSSEKAGEVASEIQIGNFS